MGVVQVFHGHSGNGPVHLAQARPHDQLSWCGVRVRFRHVERDGNMDEVTCPKCRARIRAGQPLTYRGR